MKTATTLVIGAGSTGLSTALSLAKLGETGVVVIDRSYIGSGQTGQCCGFVRTYYNSKEMAFMAHESTGQIKDLCSSVQDIDYVEKGLLVFESIERSGEVRDNIEMLGSLGVNVGYLEEDEIKRLNPYFKPKSTCAAFDRGAGYVNPELVVSYLGRSCRELGVEICEGTEAVDIKKQGSKFAVRTNRGEVIVDRVLNATAAFANKINRMLGIVLPISAINIDNAFYRLPLGPNRCQIAVADFINHFYIIPHKDFVDVSSIALDLGREVDPDKHMFNFRHSVVNEYLNLISKRIIHAEGSASIGGFSSCIDVTPDYYPILSEVDEVPNFFCAAGFSGTGFKHFPMVGKLMAELMIGGKPELLSSFRYDRFSKGEIRESVSDSYFVRK